MLAYFNATLFYKYRSHSKSILRAGHEISNDALEGSSFVDFPEILSMFGFQLIF